MGGACDGSRARTDEGAFYAELPAEYMFWDMAYKQEEWPVPLEAAVL